MLIQLIYYISEKNILKNVNSMNVWAVNRTDILVWFSTKWLRQALKYTVSSTVSSSVAVIQEGNNRNISCNITVSVQNKKKTFFLYTFVSFRILHHGK